MGDGKMGGKLSAFSGCDTWLKYPNDIPFSHDNKTDLGGYCDFLVRFAWVA